MFVTAPDWLTKRRGALFQGADGRSWFVLFGTGPQYRLTPIPAAGQFTCEVTQTINGKRLDGGTTYASPEDAVRGGLDDLRSALGW